MSFLKFSGDSSHRDNLAEMMQLSFGIRGDVAGFSTKLTNLFTDHNEVPFEPYASQVDFMNCLKPQDKLVVVQKPRQCLVGETLLKTKTGTITLKEIIEKKLSNKVQVLTRNKDGYEVYDSVVDAWETGLQDVYQVKFFSLTDYQITSTLHHKFNTIKGFKKLSDIDITKDLIITDIGYLRIKSITSVGIQQTYDITTKDYNSFFANGVHVHNSGFSTGVVARAGFEGYFNKCPEIPIISASRTQAEKVLDRIKKAFKSMPPELQPNFKTENKSMLEFQHGVKIYSLSSNPDTARGFTGNVYLDEFAMQGLRIGEELYSAVYPTITKGGRIVIVSTPKGKRNKYYNLVHAEDKVDSKSKKKIYTIRWQDIPFIKNAVENEGLFDNLTQKEIDQEYNIVYFDETEESFYTEEFIALKFRDREGEIHTFRTYEDMGLYNIYQDSSNMDLPLPKHLKLKNSDDFKHLLDKYDEFSGAWDVAITRDDSIVVVMGRYRNNHNKYDIVARFPKLKDFSADSIMQARYVKRIISFFDCKHFGIDVNGLGRGAGEFIASDVEFEDIIVKFVNKGNEKIHSYIKVKQRIEEGNLKQRYDGTKEDADMEKQMTNTANIGNRIVKVQGKDDFADLLAIWEETKDGDGNNDISFYSF